MIRLLSEGDRALVQGALVRDTLVRGALVRKAPGESFCALRIRSLCRAYGFSYDFVRFYSSGDGGTVLCVQGGLSLLWTRDAEPSRLLEAEEFLPFTADCVLTEAPLCPAGFQKKGGRTYLHSAPKRELQQGISSDLNEGFRVLSQVFSKTINQKTYAQWYTDLSHQVRHGAAKLYVLEGACAGIRYGPEDGFFGVAQLGTLPGYRGRGLAKRLLSHMAADCPAAGGILLESQTAESDRFYESAGFRGGKDWFLLSRKGIKEETLV